MRQSLTCPDAPRVLAGGWGVGDTEAAASPALLMRGSQWQPGLPDLWEQPGHLSGHLQSCWQEGPFRTNVPALASARPHVWFLISTSIVHSVAQANPQRNTITKAGTPYLSHSVTHQPASCHVASIDTSCQWRHINSGDPELSCLMLSLFMVNFM